MNLKSLLNIDLKTLLIIILIVVVIIMRMCSNDKPTTPNGTVNVGGTDYPIVQHTIDTVYVPYDTIVYKPGKKIYRDTTIYVEVPSYVDTAKILKDYYAKNVYIDSLTLTDSLGYVKVIDTIFMNTISGRIWQANLNKIKISETLVVKDPPTNQLYAGLIVGADKINLLNFVGGGLLLKTKTDKIYSIGIGLMKDNVVSIQGSVYWKIKLKK